MKQLFTFLFLLITITSYSQVRISQVYGGGGNTAATYNQDFVELFNAGSTTADISGYSVQYASATGTAWSTAVIPASSTIPPGGYFLVGLASGATGVALPTPDATGGLNLSGTSGKVALVNNSTALSGATACSGATVVDVIGYGSGSCFEGAVLSTSGIDNAKSMTRKLNGCTDDNNNSTDFTIAAVSPRNAATAVSPCGAASPSLTASPNVSGLTTTSGAPSSPLTFNLSGNSLTGFPGDITVTATTDFEVSLSSGSGFATSIQVPYTSATLASTPIYTRIAAGAAVGPVNGTVTSSGGGAATNAVVTVAGSVIVNEPGTQATNVLISNINDNGFDVNWANGNGSSRLVLVRETTTAAVPPTDGVEFTFPGTTGIGNTIIYLGSGTGPVTVTGLNAGTNYTVQVYEYNGSGGSNNYNINTATGNPATTTTTGISPFLQQGSYFTAVAVPQYGISGTANRLPIMYFANVNGLLPNTTYRYYTQAAAFTDLGSTATGAGNSLLIDYTVSPVTYTYASSVSVSTAGGYGKFTTNASGSFRGAFGFINTSNSRFNSGNMVFPSIAIAEEGATPSVQYRFALNQRISILGLGVTASDGSYIKGASAATAGNIVGLWDNVDGNLVAARPLSMTLVEHPVIGGDAWGTAATNFIIGYEQTTGSWNTIIPNSSANGVRLIQQFDISSAAVLGCNSDADGSWPSGAVTANASSGATPIVIAISDAPINSGSCFSIVPVQLKSFAVQKAGNSTRLSWTTAQEINSREFVIERSTNSRTWNSIATVAAAGNSVMERTYYYVDNDPAKGINFYRIRLVDADNQFSNTDTKSVLFSNIDVVLITPNPASSFVNIYMSKNDNSLAQVFITDANGRLVETIRTNEQVYQYNTSRLNKGVYIFKVMNNGNSSSQKVIIQ